MHLRSCTVVYSDITLSEHESDDTRKSNADWRTLEKIMF